MREHSGTARELVARRPVPASRLVVLCRVTDTALVLGSTQPAGDVDVAAAALGGVEVVRRESGGGAVLVGRGLQAWVDVFVPRQDPLYVEDVGSSFGFLGVAWRAALAKSGAAPDDALAVADAPLSRSPWTRRICFTATAPGEVTLSGRKIVGISQRRERGGAWFHSLVPLRETGSELVSYLALSAEERAEAAALLSARATHVAAAVSALEEALLAALH